MRFFVLTKRKIAALGCGVLLAGLALTVGVHGAGAIAQTVASPRKIPIYCVEQQEKVVALSFDAAWGNEQTGELLTILDQYGVKSTFFLVGEWVEKYPDSVKAIADAGHDVCNHSDTHPHMSQLSRGDQDREITSCNERIKAITGKAPILFRAPYGDYNNTVVSAANDLGMYCVQWDVDSLDWKDPTPQQMKDRVLSGLKPGSIILFHNGAKNTPEALPATIAAIQAEGYRIVPISELLLPGPYETDHEGRQRPKADEAPVSSEALQ